MSRSQASYLSGFRKLRLMAVASTVRDAITIESVVGITAIDKDIVRDTEATLVQYHSYQHPNWFLSPTDNKNNQLRTLHPRK